MRKTLIALVSTLAIAGTVAGCTTAEETAVVGAAGGALIGAAAGGPRGALIGAAAGGVGGYLVGRSVDRPGYCEYRHPRTGRIFVDRC